MNRCAHVLRAVPAVFSAIVRKIVARAHFSDIYQDIRWMTQEELLNVSGLQVVAIETSVSDLLDTAQICVDAGLHIHLDKPAGRSLSKFKKVLEVAARQSRTVQKVILQASGLPF